MVSQTPVITLKGLPLYFFNDDGTYIIDAPTKHEMDNSIELLLGTQTKYPISIYWNDTLKIQITFENKIIASWEVQRDIQSWSLVIFHNMLKQNKPVKLNNQLLENEYIMLFVAMEKQYGYEIDSFYNSQKQFTSATCGTTAEYFCPNYESFLPCSGKGTCSRACICTCDAAPSKISTLELTNQVHQYSPYRGDGCEITCPGYDGYSYDTICSNHGTCDQNGNCICNIGFTGNACQFKCPEIEGVTEDRTQSICSGHGSCSTVYISEDDFEPITNNDFKQSINAENLASFYGSIASVYRPCDEFNYYETHGAFENVYFHNEGFRKRNDAISKCLVLSECVGIQTRKRAFIINETESTITFAQCQEAQQYFSKENLIIKEKENDNATCFQQGTTFYWTIPPTNSTILTTYIHADAEISPEWTLALQKTNSSIRKKPIRIGSGLTNFAERFCGTNPKNFVKQSNLSNGKEKYSNFALDTDNTNSTTKFIVEGTYIPIDIDQTDGIVLNIEIGGTDPNTYTTSNPSSDYIQIKIKKWDTQLIIEIWNQVPTEYVVYQWNLNLEISHFKLIFECNKEPMIELYAKFKLDRSKIDTHKRQLKPSYGEKYTEIEGTLLDITECPVQTYKNFRQYRFDTYEEAKLRCNDESTCDVIQFDPTSSKYELHIFDSQSQRTSYNNSATYFIKNYKIYKMFDGQKCVKYKDNVLTVFNQIFDKSVSDALNFENVRDNDITDEEDVINIGQGLWAGCWITGTKTTQKECYKEAKDAGYYAFAFNSNTKQCLLYNKVTDKSRINLNLITSISKIAGHPCVDANGQQLNNIYWEQ